MKPYDRIKPNSPDALDSDDIILEMIKEIFSDSPLDLLSNSGSPTELRLDAAPQSASATRKYRVMPVSSEGRTSRDDALVVTKLKKPGSPQRVTRSESSPQGKSGSPGCKRPMSSDVILPPSLPLSSPYASRYRAQRRKLMKMKPVSKVGRLSLQKASSPNIGSYAARKGHVHTPISRPISTEQAAGDAIFVVPLPRSILINGRERVEGKKSVMFVDEVGGNLHRLKMYPCPSRKNMWFKPSELSFFN